jgi:negative regulator of sigma E activity
MTEHNEKLSYLLDDYRGDNPEATLDEVIGDVNLQYRMRRYQIIGDAMRHELPQAIDTDFHQSVMARIREQAEDSPQMSTQDSTEAELVDAQAFCGTGRGRERGAGHCGFVAAAQAGVGST